MLKKLIIMLIALCITSVSYAEDWKNIKTNNIDRTIYLDLDSVRLLDVPDLTISNISKQKPLMFTVKVEFNNRSEMLTKYNVKTAIFKFNTLQNIDGRNYRLTETKYYNINGSLIKTYGETNFTLLKKESMGYEADNMAMKQAISKGII